MEVADVEEGEMKGGADFALRELVNGEGWCLGWVTRLMCVVIAFCNSPLLRWPV